MAVYALATGIGAMEDANLAAQIQTALEGISLAPIIVLLNQAYMEAIQLDTLDYANATAASVMPANDSGTTGPQMAGVAAQANTQKSLDEQSANLNIGAVQNMLEDIKSTASFLGSVLDNIFMLESPMVQLLAKTTSLIMEIT